MPLEDPSQRITGGAFAPNQAARVPPSVAGRRLLLADDSLAIQKVIDLTFSDEGMAVTTVGNGQDALEKLNEFTPDVVLADVYMPGVGGYELCTFIKQNERLRHIPVILMVGTFEPFDPAEAQRAGADDVVTKPFESIRQLVGRVGSLLSSASKSPPSPEIAEEDTQPTSNVRVFVEASPLPPEIGDEDAQPPSNVRVFVEAEAMADDVTADEGPACPTNIEMQTADTQKLEPIERITDQATEIDIDDTIEIEAVAVSDEPPSTSRQAAGGASSDDPNYESQGKMIDAFDDGVLDLGDVDSFVSARTEDDFVLDLDVETVTRPDVLAGDEIETAEMAAIDESIADEPLAQTVSDAAVKDTQEWPTETDSGEPQQQSESLAIESSATPVSSANLSPEAIEAISRRVVEQLSDKVIREIAWEVVPELSELLIKQKLKEKE